MKKFLLPLVLCAGVAGCDQAPDGKNAGRQTPPAAGAQSPVTALQGRWIGPEGTYLDLQMTGDTDKAIVKVRNLDGERTFDGAVSGETISFERDGTRESIRRGDGQETGMKWLADKTDCIVVKTGEGYCRD